MQTRNFSRQIDGPLLCCPSCGSPLGRLPPVAMLCRRAERPKRPSCESSSGTPGRPQAQGYSCYRRLPRPLLPCRGGRLTARLVRRSPGRSTSKSESAGTSRNMPPSKLRKDADTRYRVASHDTEKRYTVVFTDQADSWLLSEQDMPHNFGWPFQ